MYNKKGWLIDSLPLLFQVRQAMMRVVCYLEDSFGVTCKPVSFSLLKKALPMFLWDRKNQEPTLVCKIGSMQVITLTTTVSLDSKNYAS